MIMDGSGREFDPHLCIECAEALAHISGLGCMVTEVNGETAIYEENGAYWGFFVNGEYCNYGISDQPVNDGDAFSIVYTKA